MMTLDEALHYIHAVCWKGSIPGLERITALLDAMGHPERKCKFVHVAGTNGKGSTCAMLASIFQAAGYKTGLYTSPYIVVTVANHGTDYARRIDDGAAIFNVAAGSATAEIVADIRAQFPDMPIMATGGPTDESVLRTIDAGANAITYTPPSTADLFKHTMERYRMGLPYEHE